MKYDEYNHASGLRMPRSRGAVSGLLLVVLGAWGALIPFVGPHFDFAYTPDHVWAWTSARGWLEVLAGAWFVIGDEVAPILGIGSAGDPVAATDRKRAVLEISYFSGLGALIVFFGGIVLALTTVRLARDVPPAAAPAAPAEPPAYQSYAAPYQEPEPAPQVSPDALTQPREGQRKSPKGWRRQRADAV